jgi:uncharacterized membrane protein YfhO
VHQAIPAEAVSALWLIDSGAVDPRLRVFVPEKTELPELTDSPAGATESVEVVHYEADEIRLQAELAAPGIVVVSETYAPGWKAYVDGEETTLYLADGVIRGVAAPEGSHEIVLRYEPLSLRLGFGLSIATFLAVAALAIFFAYRDRRSKSGASDPA